MLAGYVEYHPVYGPPTRTYQDGGTYVMDSRTVEREGRSSTNEFRFEAAPVDLLRASCAGLISLRKGLPWIDHRGLPAGPRRALEGPDRGSPCSSASRYRIDVVRGSPWPECLQEARRGLPFGA